MKFDQAFKLIILIVFIWFALSFVSGAMMGRMMRNNSMSDPEPDSAPKFWRNAFFRRTRFVRLR